MSRPTKVSKLAEINYADVKLIKNPIKQIRIKIPFANQEGKVFAEFLPTYFELIEGLWETKINSVTYCVPATQKFQCLFTLQTDLTETFQLNSAVKSNENALGMLQLFGTTTKFQNEHFVFFTFELKMNGVYYFVRNPSEEWIQIDAKPYNGFNVKITPHQEVYKIAPNNLPRDVKGTFLVEMLFRRLK